MVDIDGNQEMNSATIEVEGVSGMSEDQKL
jgi:hypothetical protein